MGNSDLVLVIFSFDKVSRSVQTYESEDVLRKVEPNTVLL